jgi:hypothetical protein
MKLSKKLEQKLKQEGLKTWKYWVNIFLLDINYPANITKEQREVIAHNLALQVIWNSAQNKK